MSSAVDAARAGMMRNQVFMDAVANNLANTNTTGYKRRSVHFQDILTTEDYLRLVEAANPDELLGTDAGVEVSAVAPVFTPGPLQASESPLHAAIDGDGFFQVRLPDGTVAYTRDGSFTLDGLGRVVTSDGYFLLGENGPITIPANATGAGIDPDGSVVVTYDDGTPPQTVAAIQLARFVNPEGLVSAGDNLFLPSENSGAPIVGRPGTNGLGGTRGSTLEASNVDVGGEMTNMILAQRAFQFNLRAYQVAEEMLRQANDANA